MKANKNLHAARTAKNDEFYTAFNDIDPEMKNYYKHFLGKSVYCNCDNPAVSNFHLYFKEGFEFLGLRCLVSTGFNEGGRGFKSVVELIDGKLVETRSELDGDGDFRSPECVALLNECDVVVTNPPFSLFREFVALVLGAGKGLLCIGNTNAITYKDVFSHIMADNLWLGVRANVTMEFELHPSYEKFNREDNGKKYGKVPAIAWFTNLTHRKRTESQTLWATLAEGRKQGKYPQYDNYNAIEVSRVNEIPQDYEGVMGVPITFLCVYCPEQFEIVRFRKGDDDKDLSVGGSCPYFRILIRKRQGAAQ
jgi:hypothetical protein